MKIVRWKLAGISSQPEAIFCKEIDIQETLLGIFDTVNWMVKVNQ